MRGTTRLLAAVAACGVGLAVAWWAFVYSESHRLAASAIAEQRVERARNWTHFVAELQSIILDLLWAAGVVALCVVAVILILVVVGFIARQQERRNRAIDGLYGLREVRIDGGRVLIDPNRMVGAALVVGANGVAELPAGAGWDVQASITAGAQRVQMAQVLGDVRYAAHGKLLAGHYDKAPPVISQLPEPPAEQEQEQRPVELIQSVNGVLSVSAHDALLLGQNRQSGKLAVFDPTTSVHVGIIGVTGTGKTVSCGYVLVAQALQHGWHVVILDPKGGADWRLFAPAAEWHESDDRVFADQVALLEREHQRRQGMAAVQRKASVRDIVGAPASMLVIVEEYGDLIRSLRRRDNKAATLVDDMLDTLMRRARSSDMHLVFIDQYPEHWSHQVIGGTKCKAVFQLGPNQGAKVEEYKAASLPDRGEFLVKGQSYTAWNGAKAVPRWLTKRAFQPIETPIIDADYTVHEPFVEVVHEPFIDRSPEVDPTLANARTNAPSTEDSWHDWTLTAYLPHHPELLTTDPQGRGVGIAGLARAMAGLRYSDPGQYELMKSTASAVAARLRKSARVNGAPLGSDTTIQESHP